MSDLVAVSFVLLLFTASAYAEDSEKEGMFDTGGTTSEEIGDPGGEHFESAASSDSISSQTDLDGELDHETKDAHASLPSYNNPVPEPVVKQSKLYGATSSKDKGFHKLSREEKIKKALAKKPKAKKSKQVAKAKKSGKVKRSVASKKSSKNSNKKLAKRSTGPQRIRR